MGKLYRGLCAVMLCGGCIGEAGLATDDETATGEPTEQGPQDADAGADAAVVREPEGASGPDGSLPPGEGPGRSGAVDAGVSSSEPDAAAPGPDASGPQPPAQPQPPDDPAPSPTGTPVWVGVGNWGLRTVTFDGENWDVQANAVQGSDHTEDLLRNVAVGDGVIIAVGGNLHSMIMRSTDGESWDVDVHPEGNAWMGGVAHADGLWIAGGGTGNTLRSTDAGLSWQSGANVRTAVRDMAAGDGVFVAVGDTGMIAVSEDGTAWTDRTIEGAVRFDHVAHVDGLWVVAGSQWNGAGFDTDCYQSTDAETWKACPVDPSHIRGVVGTDGRILVTHDDGHAHTTDAQNWQSSTVVVPGYVYEHDGRWVGAYMGSRYAGPSLDALSQQGADREIREFAFGYLDP